MFGELAEGIASCRTLCATKKRHSLYVGATTLIKSRIEVATGMVRQIEWRKEASSALHTAQEVFVAEVYRFARGGFGRHSVIDQQTSTCARATWLLST